MIPLLRSINELMAITQTRDRSSKGAKNNEYNQFKEDSGQRKRYIRSKGEKGINLPNLPNLPRRRRVKWKKSKEAVSKFLDGLDYNNQIQSSYELTLIERQVNNNQNDVA